MCAHGNVPEAEDIASKFAGASNLALLHFPNENKIREWGRSVLPDSRIHQNPDHCEISLIRFPFNAFSP